MRLQYIRGGAVVDAGLEEMLSVSPAAEPAAPAQVPAQAQQQQAPAQTQQAAAKADQNAEQPEPQFRAPPPANALRPAPFIPDFVLNPGLEAVEEDYSSSDYSDEEI